MSYCCPKCGTPTDGAEVLMPGETVPTKIEMCQMCWDYIGSPAANLPGATMKNRIQMEQIIKKQEK